ncbi:A24 family peptidase [Propionicimonas sp.]|uniref:prepilin peptidase n=1 Tax=Propionicimonas sp. TaxID=1955623 RepID=UPI0017E2D5FD|nr:A24 family peptidase [Propionicimonas sp.]MBU3975802.1 A24 family peptidase [Actinomycetota bacterium]MBA3022209.1 prepilin peptidase [Propionicimonas sp.]MBU3987352.1 A24 family peptidase [Actinomycetota bacterium]MBU4006429.1 A24 family peptidase [Actinomycetota bacterium]MBU4065308.1 A24 family peptidase [Actinomycetota bacterium]
MNLLAVAVAALVAGAAAAALNSFMRAQFETETQIAKTWLQVPIAVVLGALAGMAPSLIEQVTFTVLAVAAALLTVIDLGDYRLPDVIVLPLYPLLAAGLTIAAWTQDRWGSLGRAGIVAVAMFVLYFVMAIFAPDLGFGDVKLAGVVGGFLGWFGLSQSLAGFLLAWVLMAVVGIVMILTRLIKAKGSLPFGPYLVLGAVAAVFLGPTMFPALA